MKPLLRCVIQIPGLVCVWLLLAWPVQVIGEAFPREDGPVGLTPQYLPEPQWQEQGGHLPAWPQAGQLLEVEVDTPGFRTYIDPQSLTAGEDRVVRFTSVLVSASGVWNVTYEGLHCGDERYRRIAYGSAGQWHELPVMDWQPLTTSGAGRYRKILYYDYLCNPVEPYKGADVILRRMRASQRTIGD